MQFKKITIVGVGLLGGSIGLAARRRKVAGEIAGFVRRAASVKDCERAGAVNYATTDLLAAVSNADLVILCTPLAQMKSLAQHLLPALKRGAIVTDVGSVKTGVVRELESIFAQSGAYFIGGHPMAGGEKMGVQAARADLFENAICILTPTKNSNARAVRKLEQFWKSIGCRTQQMTVAEHDVLVSRSSHLPHMLAATLATVVLNPKLSKAQAGLCATGFRDTTRIAAGSPEMWRDIALANRKYLSSAMDAFAEELKKIQTALQRGDAAAVEKFYATAKRRRDDWSARAAMTSSE